MISAIISVVIGILSLIATIPVVVPVIGLGLGANALIRERKKEDKKQAVIGIAIVGLVFNGIVTLIFLVNSYSMWFK
ncbi:MAG: hypothetical protein GY839_05090 [candidate division Zixibacteria bacterium]|nr:hypothetical protein [candidate division Zixibacteria bacterium]